MKRIINYTYIDAISGKEVSGEIPMAKDCAICYNNHKRKIARKGKITVWEVLVG